MHTSALFTIVSRLTMREGLCSLFGTLLSRKIGILCATGKPWGRISSQEWPSLITRENLVATCPLDLLNVGLCKTMLDWGDSMRFHPAGKVCDCMYCLTCWMEMGWGEEMVGGNCIIMRFSWLYYYVFITFLFFEGRPGFVFPGSSWPLFLLRPRWNLWPPIW